MNTVTSQVQNHPLLTEENYNRFRDLVTARTGLYFGARRRDFFTAIIRTGAQKAGCTCFEEYYTVLKNTATDDDPWSDLIPYLTVCETYFFRDDGLMAALRKNLLPDLINLHQVDRSLRLWSAGCATGEEPYTLAILLRQLLPDVEQWRVTIRATDINRQALAQAITGRYRLWSFRQTNPAIREKYFTQQDASYVIDPQLRSMVKFDYLNMAEFCYPRATNQTNCLDLILWRNVSLYLPEIVTREVADRLYNCLMPGGWLVVGPSEVNFEIYSRFEMVRYPDAFVFRKPSGVNSSSAFPSFAESQVISPVKEIKYKYDLDEWKASETAGEIPEFTVSPSLLKKEDSIVTGVSETIVDAYQEGLAWMKKKKSGEALKCFMSSFEQNSGDAMVCHQIACLFADGGRLSEARKWAERAVEYNPLMEEAHYTLGLIHHELGEVEVAISRLKQALYLQPDFILAHLGLANFYNQQGRSADAARHRAQVVRLASRLALDAVLPGSDNLTVKQLLAQL